MPHSHGKTAKPLFIQCFWIDFYLFWLKMYENLISNPTQTFCKIFLKICKFWVTSHYLNILLCKKCLEKSQTLKLSDSISQKLRAVFFCLDSCIDSRYFPIKIQDGQVWTLLEKVNIVNVFFWKFIIFSQILKFEVLYTSINWISTLVNLIKNFSRRMSDVKADHGK